MIQQRERSDVISKFYVVQKAGIPAIWQSDPQQIERLLKRKLGFTVVSDTPSDTRSDALNKLRQLFPGSRRLNRAS
jgi:hypothetical protein